MGFSHKFKGVSGAEYEHLLTSIDNVDRASMQPGTIVLAASGPGAWPNTEPEFLWCQEAACLRTWLVAAGLQRHRAMHSRLCLYIRIDSARDKAKRDAEVADITSYYRGSKPLEAA